MQNFAQVESGQKTRAIAAQQAGFANHETYRQAKKIVDQGTPELVAAVDASAVSISNPLRLAQSTLAGDLPRGNTISTTAPQKRA